MWGIYCQTDGLLAYSLIHAGSPISLGHDFFSHLTVVVEEVAFLVQELTILSSIKCVILFRVLLLLFVARVYLR